jgi:hypothetical protein
MNQFSLRGILGESLTSNVDAVAIPTRELIRKLTTTGNEHRTMSNAPGRVNQNATRYTPGTEPTATAVLQYHRDLWSTQQQNCPNAKGLDAELQKLSH